MLGGYIGTILEVDLTRGKLTDTSLEENIPEMFLGGKGLALKMIYDRFKPDIDPLGPDNTIIFATGPATGTAYPTSGRYHVITMRSPLTGLVGSANSGGKWGPYLKFAGYDAVIIKGASATPVYLSIINGKAELKDASGIWGMNTFSTTDTILKRLDQPKASVACIGPAGENKVSIACIINEKYRAAGRCGAGAVMGSKNLKAIAVYGTGTVPIARPDALKQDIRTALGKIKENKVTSEGLPTYGTAVLVNAINDHGGYPTRNFQDGYFPEADRQNGPTLSDTYLIKKKACWGCPIGCGRVSEVSGGAYSVSKSEGPEYETIFAFGSDCGIADLEPIIKANYLCNELGLDTISMGATIACAMELVENGKIPSSVLSGLDLAFGNAEAMVEAVWRTAYRAGFGAELAHGSRKMAEKFQRPDLSMSVKGLELPAYDPRSIQGIGLNFATANRGGCHVSGYMIAPEITGLPEKLDPHTTSNKAEWTITFQDFTSVVNSAVVCLFNTFALDLSDYTHMLSSITGWDKKESDVLTIGERVTNLERVMNNRYGVDEKDDTLPERLLTEPLQNGASKGKVSQLLEMLPEYYNLRGWENGTPTDSKLKELGLL